MAIPTSNIKLSDIAEEVYGSIGTNRKLSGLVDSALDISGPPYKWSEFSGYTQPILSVSPTNLRFDIDGNPYTVDTFDITVAFPSQAWSLVDDQSWCTETPTSGTGDTTITVSVTPRVSGTLRTARITISSDKCADETVTVQQDGV